MVSACDEDSVGVGLTVKVKLPLLPVQPLAAGTIVMVATLGKLAVSVTTNDTMLSVPPVVRPIVVSLFVQL